MPTPRNIKLSWLAREIPEGDGAMVRRSIGSAKLRNFTPFLMLDHAKIENGASFPDHPHRGQETITYVLDGAVDHEDFTGSKGRLEKGDLQFMTAGRGIMHAEMPDQNVPVNEALQFWVDLPLALKACEPRYRDLRATEIPLAESGDGKVQVKVISGKSLGVDSVKDLSYQPVWLLDITIQPGGRISQELPQGWNAFAWTLDGIVTFADGTSSDKSLTVKKHHNVVFEQAGDVVIASVDENASESAHFVLAAGQPLDQPIVQYGPFVMTSKEDIYQAMRDFQTSSNGFERAANWQSDMSKRLGR